MLEQKRNFFDDLGAPIDQAEALKYQQDAESKAEKLDFLIHKVFKQSPNGRELIKIWQQSLMMVSTAEAGMDNIEIGIREGQKRFIKGILLTVKRVGESK